MRHTLMRWKDLMADNFEAKDIGEPLKGQIVSFYVDRKPSAPVV